MMDRLVIPDGRVNCMMQVIIFTVIAFAIYMIVDHIMEKKRKALTKEAKELLAKYNGDESINE